MFATTSKFKIKAAALFAAAIVALAPQVSAAAPGMELNGKTFNDWTMRCSEATNQQTQAKVTVCEATQRIVNAEGTPVMEVVVTIPPNQSEAVGVIIAPLGVVLPAGIAVSIDGNAMGKLPYLRCVNQGCLGQFVFTADQLAAWKRGVKAEVTVVRGNGQEVKLPLSLSGFTAATDALR